jgi:hypothetical protein
MNFSSSGEAALIFGVRDPADANGFGNATNKVAPMVANEI